MSEGFTNPANTNLGNTVYAELSLGDTQDQLADAQRVSGNSISSLEKELAEAASLDNNPEAVSKWAKDHGYGDVKNQNALVSMIQSKMDRSTQVFMTLQKARDRSHDIMMEVIRSLGKV